MLQPNSFLVSLGRIVWCPAVRLTYCLAVSILLEPMTTKCVLSALITSLLLTIYSSTTLYVGVLACEGVGAIIHIVHQTTTGTAVQTRLLVREWLLMLSVNYIRQVIGKQNVK